MIRENCKTRGLGCQPLSVSLLHPRQRGLIRQQTSTVLACPSPRFRSNSSQSEVSACGRFTKTPSTPSHLMSIGVVCSSDLTGPLVLTSMYCSPGRTLRFIHSYASPSEAILNSHLGPGRRRHSVRSRKSSCDSGSSNCNRTSSERGHRASIIRCAPCRSRPRARGAPKNQRLYNGILIASL